jgi:hypothetical protein
MNKGTRRKTRNKAKRWAYVQINRKMREKHENVNTKRKAEAKRDRDQQMEV